MRGFFKSIEYMDRAGTKFLILIFVISLVVRLVAGIYGFNTRAWESFGEDNARVVFANSIIENGFILERTNYVSPEFIFAPFIPIVLAIKKMVFGESWLPIFILNAVVGAVGCILIFLISRLFFSRKVSILAFAWAAFYPSYIRYTASGGNEPWVVLFFLMTVYFGLKVIEQKKIGLNLFLFSLAFSLLFHTDERYISYSVFFPFLLFIGDSNLFLKFKKVIIFISATVLFSAPWLIRNYIVYDDIVLISCRTNNITNPIFKHREELMFFDHTPDNTYLSPGKIDSVRNGLLNTFSDGTRIYESQIKAMKAGNIPHRFSTLESLYSRLAFLWMPLKLRDNYRIEGYSFNPAWSFKHNIISGLSYGLLLPFALFGLWVLYNQGRAMELFLFSSILVYHTFIHILFIPYTRDRYRNPIDFIIIILGCYGLLYGIELLLNRKKKIK